MTERGRVMMGAFDGWKDGIALDARRALRRENLVCAKAGCAAPPVCLVLFSAAPGLSAVVIFLACAEHEEPIYSALYGGPVSDASPDSLALSLGHHAAVDPAVDPTASFGAEEHPTGGAPAHQDHFAGPG